MSAFVQPDLDTGKHMFAYLPDDLLTDEQRALCKLMRKPVFRLRKPIYGLPIANRWWNKHLSGVMVGKLKYEEVESWPLTFVRDVKSSPHKQVVTWYVDDGSAAGPDKAAMWREIRQHIDMTDPEPIKKILGVSFTLTKLPNGCSSIESHMRPYFQSAVAIYQENKLAPPLTKYAPTLFLEPAPLLEVTPGVLAPFAESLLMKLFVRCAPDMQFCWQLIAAIQIPLAIHRCERCL